MAPRYLYKICDAAPPDPLPVTLSPTELDTADGFILLSTAAQVPVTAKLFFNDNGKLWVLKLDSQALDGVLDFSTDPKAGVKDGCAHLHYSRKGLGLENVVEVIVVERIGAETWTDVEDMGRL